MQIIWAVKKPPSAPINKKKIENAKISAFFDFFDDEEVFFFFDFVFDVILATSLSVLTVVSKKELSGFFVFDDLEEVLFFVVLLDFPLDDFEVVFFYALLVFFVLLDFEDELVDFFEVLLP